MNKGNSPFRNTPTQEKVVPRSIPTGGAPDVWVDVAIRRIMRKIFT